jgi:hypothetical protein
MFSKKQLIIISFVLAILFHFVFYINYYGPVISLLHREQIYLIALLSAMIMIFVYLGTYWRSDIKGRGAILLFDLLVLWIIICFFRSILLMRSLSELKPFLFSNYMALSLLPVLFFIVGININYFHAIDNILIGYIVLATLVSFFFINYFELQLYLIYPLFFLIITIPLRSFWLKIFLITVSISVIAVSLTNRAGILRILISYCILTAYYIMLYIKVNRKLVNTLVFLILMVPVVSLYLAIKGQSVFQMVLGEDNSSYSQLNPQADTRTLLYYEVFQDLHYTDTFIFGKGLNAGYYSETFETFKREIVEVGFLQILLKTGIVGLILYISVIISAIIKALGRSKNLFMKSLGLLLVSYVIMFFVENQIAYNLLNIIIWMVVGMCHSEKLRSLTNQEFEKLFRGQAI